MMTHCIKLRLKFMSQSKLKKKTLDVIVGATTMFTQYRFNVI